MTDHWKLDRSDRCRAEHWEESWLAGHVGLLHRKRWEHAIIFRVFREQALEAGSHVLGFGVGTDPLPYLFLSEGAKVLATDLHADEAGGWSRSGQHLLGRVAAGVEYREVNMNRIPRDLMRGQFDFVWSSSSLEHIGGIAAGQRFVLESMKCVKPGRLAVHTTEFGYEMCDDEPIVEGPDLCFFRADHLEELRRDLRTNGDLLWPLDLEPGTAPADLSVDTKPYSNTLHINIALGGIRTTSVCLVVERGGAG